MKTETDKEIVASNEAPKKIKFKADESSARKDGIEEKYDREKRGTKGRRKKRYTDVKRCKNLCEEKGKKGAHM